MLDTEQGDIALETQQDSDSSDEDTMLWGHRRARAKSRARASHPGKGNMY